MAARFTLLLPRCAQHFRPSRGIFARAEYVCVSTATMVVAERRLVHYAHVAHCTRSSVVLDRTDGSNWRRVVTPWTCWRVLFSACHCLVCTVVNSRRRRPSATVAVSSQIL